MNNEELKTIFDNILFDLGSHAESVEDLFAMWINIGRKIGIDLHCPHLKVVLNEDENGERHFVAVVGSPSEDLVQDLCSEENISPEHIEKIFNLTKENIH